MEDCGRDRGFSEDLHKVVSEGVGAWLRVAHTDLSASGGSLQPARPRCCSILALLRKRCSAAGAALAARDFLCWGWEEGKVGFRLLELISRSLCLPGLRGAPYPREKIFLDASRWVRLEQQPPDKAAKSWEGRRDR